MFYLQLKIAFQNFDKHRVMIDELDINEPVDFFVIPFQRLFGIARAVNRADFSVGCIEFNDLVMGCEFRKVESEFVEIFELFFRRDFVVFVVAFDRHPDVLSQNVVVDFVTILFVNSDF